jgi:hypothetical protein
MVCCRDYLAQFQFGTYVCNMPQDELATELISSLSTVSDKHYVRSEDHHYLVYLTAVHIMNNNVCVPNRARLLAVTNKHPCR